MTNSISNVKYINQNLFSTKEATNDKDFFDTLLSVFDAKDKKHYKKTDTTFNLFSDASSLAFSKGLLSGIHIPDSIHDVLNDNKKMSNILQETTSSHLLKSLSSAKGNLEKQAAAYKNSLNMSQQRLQQMEKNIALVEQLFDSQKNSFMTNLSKNQGAKRI
ncbi:hypothetical protein [Bacillus ndiopicus]|uniref:hypothetical protein n=1 Tax=Bacillus ndiopicus TaxID=1347368 RepID=UPI0005A85444|nr:hypothetical protein [Bacillus ndiopicus]